MKRNIHAEIANTIATELENGAAPWVKPWSSTGEAPAPLGIPRNAITGRKYSGANVILLWIRSMSEGWTDGRFATFKQIKAEGGTVKKGSKGTTVLYYGAAEKKDNTGEVIDRYMFAKAFTVFNLSQTEGLDHLEDNRETFIDGMPIGEFAEALGVDLRHGGEQAFCAISPAQRTAYIQMPHLADFDGEASYQATLLHELVHWTGAPQHLDRKNRYDGEGKKSYAFEELVAELGAAMLCAEFGIRGDLRHAGYIESWGKLLRDDDRAFTSAAAAAQKAVNFLRDKAMPDAITADSVAA
jgi:antirestriction protein ArdC